MLAGGTARENPRAVAVIRTRGAGGHDREHIADLVPGRCQTDGFADHAPRMCGVEN